MTSETDYSIRRTTGTGEVANLRHATDRQEEHGSPPRRRRRRDDDGDEEGARGDLSLRRAEDDLDAADTDDQADDQADGQADAPEGPTVDYLA